MKSTITLLTVLMSLCLGTSFETQAQAQVPQTAAGPAPAEATPSPEASRAQEAMSVSSETVPLGVQPGAAPTTKHATHVEHARLEQQATRLESALAHLADHAAISTGGILFGLAYGSSVVGIGLYVGIDGAGMGTGGGRALASGLLLTLGTSALVNTFHAFGRVTTDEERLARFRAARAAGKLDESALVRFEGELQAEVEVARYQRIVGGVQYIGMAIGGAGVIAVAAVVEDLDDDARLLAGVLGGTYVALGSVLAAMLLAGESEYERVQRAYRAPAESTKATVTVAPSVGTSAVGLSVAGTF